LYSKAGCWLCLHEVEEKPGSPPPLAQTLRRLLDNARLTAVEQQGFDRIAVFRLERGPDRFDIIFEIFSRGNLVVGREGKIVAVLSAQKFKDRAVEIGEQYIFPVAGIDPLELDRGGFAAAVRGAKGQGVRVLATVGSPSSARRCRTCGRRQRASRRRPSSSMDTTRSSMNYSVRSGKVGLRRNTRKSRRSTARRTRLPWPSGISMRSPSTMRRT